MTKVLFSVLALVFILSSSGAVNVMNILASEPNPVRDKSLVTLTAITDGIEQGGPWNRCEWFLNGESVCVQLIDPEVEGTHMRCEGRTTRFYGGRYESDRCKLEIIDFSEADIGTWNVSVIGSIGGAQRNIEVYTHRAAQVEMDWGGIVTWVGNVVSVECTASNGRPEPSRLIWTLDGSDAFIVDPSYGTQVGELVRSGDTDAFGFREHVSQTIKVTMPFSGNKKLRCSTDQSLDQGSDLPIEVNRTATSIKMSGAVITLWLSMQLLNVKM